MSHHLQTLIIANHLHTPVLSNHLQTLVMSHHLQTHESNILQNTIIKLTDSGQFANLVPFDQSQK